MLAACTSAAPSGGKSYTLDAADYSFTAPETIEGGLVTFKIKNVGKEAHHAQLIRPNEGVSLDRVVDALKKEDLSILASISAPGGLAAIDPNGTAEVTMNLKEGQYILACFLPSPDGKSHIAKGMLKTFRVTAGGASGPEPSARATITLKDFSFDQPDSLPAGKNTFKVVNAGPQFHEWSLFKPAPGKTAEDVAKFFSGPPSGPPPFETMGGINGLSKDVFNYVTLDLKPGNYVAICAIPDSASGKPHFALGMVKNFTVK